MKTTTEEGTTYWVCEDCYLVHAGYDEHELGRDFDREPLSMIVDTAEVTAGLLADEHDDDCPVWLGDPSRADVPVDGEECECETVSFTWSRCDGCGSRLGGERHALTVWTAP
jgi:hypothetical protein